ncbi:MAG: sugar phosphate isomerase/epimerase [Gammaproteobacteria bacterium]|nr:sugar phosphate isomerase/epimerase [Gammaproteobacteria bacterium]
MNAMNRLGVISDGISRDVRVAAETARAAGLSDIEFQYMWEFEVGDLPAARRREARQLVEDNGLRVSCISRHIFARQTVHIEPDSKAYREQMDALKRCIDCAHELGASTVRIMSCRRETILFGGGGAEQWVVANGAWDKLLKLLEAPLELAAREDVKLVIETGNGTMINSAYTMGRLIDELDADGRLLALWDPCNALYCGEPPCPDGAQALAGGKIGHVHIKDAVVRPQRATVNFCRLGEGDMAAHLQGIADFLRAENYAGSISLESTYRPDRGDFADGFHESLPLFMQIYGA